MPNPAFDRSPSRYLTYGLFGCWRAPTPTPRPPRPPPSPAAASPPHRPVSGGPLSGGPVVGGTPSAGPSPGGPVSGGRPGAGPSPGGPAPTSGSWVPLGGSSAAPGSTARPGALTTKILAVAMAAATTGARSLG